MNHLKLFENFQADKGHIGDGIGIMYHPELQVLYVGSSKDSKINYTLKDVAEDDVEEIKKSLQDLDPKLWKKVLTDVGFDVSDGTDYFDITKDK